MANAGQRSTFRSVTAGRPSLMQPSGRSSAWAKGSSTRGSQHVPRGVWQSTRERRQRARELHPERATNQRVAVRHEGGLGD